MRKNGSGGLVAGVVACVLALGIPHGDSEAQVRGGVEGMYTSGSAAVVDHAYGLGGRLMVELPRLPVEVHGIFNYHFPSCPSGSPSCSSWTAAGNVVYRGGGGPYFIGGGVSFHQRDFTLEGTEGSEVVKDWGMNITLGLILPVLQVIDPIVEFRYELYDEVQDQFVISLGVVFPGSEPQGR